MADYGEGLCARYGDECGGDHLGADSCSKKGCSLYVERPRVLLIQVIGPDFCGGLELLDDVVVKASPILEHVLGWSSWDICNKLLRPGLFLRVQQWYGWDDCWPDSNGGPAFGATPHMNGRRCIATGGPCG